MWLGVCSFTFEYLDQKWRFRVEIYTYIFVYRCIYRELVEGKCRASVGLTQDRFRAKGLALGCFGLPRI